MIFTKPSWPYITVSYQGSKDGKGGKTFVDNSNSAIFEITSPPIIHNISDLGIGQVTEQDRYLLGFIQFITEYKSIIEYQQGIVEMKVPIPSNDGGGETAEHYKNPQFEYPCVIPWYAPPLKVGIHDNGTKGHEAFKLFTKKLKIGDAPQVKVPALHNNDSKNVLVSVAQDFSFETWLVVWDKNSGSPINYLCRNKWQHHMLCKFKPFPKIDGATCESAEVSNVTIGEPCNNPMGPIPPKALMEPSANEVAKRGAEYRGNKNILEHTAKIE